MEKDFEILLEALKFYVSEFGIRMTTQELEVYKKYLTEEEKQYLIEIESEI